MRILRLALLFCAAALGACRDGTEPRRPTAVEVSPGAWSGPAGLALSPGPAFTVRDQHDAPMAGVPVRIAVVAGGGTLAGAPTESSREAVPVGAWTLGPRAGANELEVAVEGLPPVRIPAAGVPGPAEKLSPAGDAAIVGRVGSPVDALPRAVLSDAFDNPVAGVPVTVAVSAGEAPDTVTSGADGTVLVPRWTLGTARGEQTLTMTAGPATATFTALARPGPPSRMEVVAGADQAAPAGSALPAPILVSLRDEFENPVDGVEVAFAVVDGAGTTDAAAATTDADGLAAAPAWRLGRSAVPQRLRAAAGGLSAEVRATVASDFDPEVRFFGPAPTAAQREAFTRAAARLRAAIVGDLSPVRVAGLDLSVCGVSGVAPLGETLDDLVVFASVQPIDGPGNVLAAAGPCYVRTGGGLPVIGVMRFDEADLARMEERGNLADVVLHEMLHVLGIGIGIYWDPLLTGKGTPGVAYTGSGGLRGCGDSGGAAVCGASVPVENTGGAGTAGSHWRESVFASELMTGYSGTGAMPLSRITVGSLGDIGYRANLDAPDPFSIPGSGFRPSAAVTTGQAMDRTIQPVFEVGEDWEVRPIPAGSPSGTRRER